MSANLPELSAGVDAVELGVDLLRENRLYEPHRIVCVSLAPSLCAPTRHLAPYCVHDPHGRTMRRIPSRRTKGSRRLPRTRCALDVNTSTSKRPLPPNFIQDIVHLKGASQIIPSFQTGWVRSLAHSPLYLSARVGRWFTTHG